MWDQGNGSSHDQENGRRPNWGITLTTGKTQNQSFKNHTYHLARHRTRVSKMRKRWSSENVTILRLVKTETEKTTRRMGGQTQSLEMGTIIGAKTWEIKTLA